MRDFRKHLMTVITLLITMGGILSAQAVELNLGGVVGIAASRLDIENWGGSNWHTDVAFGGFLAVELNTSFSIRPGVTYVQRGGEYTDQGSHPDGSLAYVDEASYSVSYLEIPVLFRYRTSSAAGYSPVLIAGPVWRAALSSEMNWNRDEIDDWADASDLAFAVGFGFESQLGRYLASVDLIYSRSVGGVGDGEDYTFGGALEGVGASLGVSF